MGEVVNVLVAFAVIIFLLRWILSGEDHFQVHDTSCVALVVSLALCLTSALSCRKRYDGSEISYKYPGFPTEKCHSRNGRMRFLFGGSTTYSDNRSTLSPQCFLIFQCNSLLFNWKAGGTLTLKFWNRDNIRFDLLRTGSVELTTNKILEKGYLDPVILHLSSLSIFVLTSISHLQPSQSYYTLHPRQTVNHPTSQSTANGTSQSRPKAESLISRYNLEDRLRKGESIPEEEIEQVGGKAAWEDAPEKREASLRERKAKMVLAARQSVPCPCFLICSITDVPYVTDVSWHNNRRKQLPVLSV